MLFRSGLTLIGALIIACCVLRSNNFLIPPHMFKLIWTNSSFFSIAEVKLLLLLSSKQLFSFFFLFQLETALFLETYPAALRYITTCKMIGGKIVRLRI